MQHIVYHLGADLHLGKNFFNFFDAAYLSKEYLLYFKWVP